MTRILPRDRAGAVAAQQAGKRLKFLFFWGHKPSHHNAISKSCLSQWWAAPFNIDGKRYATCEHYMMAAKARLFEDEETEQRILGAPHPHAAKTYGRQVRGFNQDLWKAKRLEIVVTANLAKFTQHPELGRFLRDTNNRVLVEASPVDRIWGIGIGADNPDATRPSKWRGDNLLGFALMEVRNQLSSPCHAILPALLSLNFSLQMDYQLMPLSLSFSKARYKRGQLCDTAVD